MGRATSEAFWTEAQRAGHLDSQGTALVKDLLIYLNRSPQDLADFVSEYNGPLVTVLCRLLRAQGSPDLTDLSLKCTDTLLTVLPIAATSFRNVALAAWLANTAEREARLEEYRRSVLRAAAEDAIARERAAAATAERKEGGASPSGAGAASSAAVAAAEGGHRRPVRKQLPGLETLGRLQDGEVFVSLLKLLYSKDKGYHVRKALRILSTLVAEDVPADHPVHRHFFRWLSPQLALAQGHTQLLCLGALKDVLKNTDTHWAFEQEQVMFDLTSLLARDTANMQVLYLVGFSFWLLSFNPALDRLMHSFLVVPELVRLVRKVSREKVVRICFAMLANVRGRSTFVEEMIGVDLHRLVQTLRAKSWKDPDVVSDISLVADALTARLNELSSFDVYTTELLAGALRKSPVHSEKFWRENAIKFEDNNYQLVRLITAQLAGETAEAVEMACFDLGEFARFHPDGRRVLTRLDAKGRLMALLAHKDPSIAKAALLAVQKLMVAKWDAMLSAGTSSSGGAAGKEAVSPKA